MSIQQSGVISGEPKGFKDLFDKHHFKIPEYQRDFEWEDDNIKKFQTDIIKEYVKSTQYFFGPMVFVSRPEAQSNPDGSINVDVIDGQQRLTSASLFIAAASDLLYTHGTTTEQSLAKANYLLIANQDQAGTRWMPKILPHQKYQPFYTDLLQLCDPSTKTGQNMSGKTAVEKTMYKAYKLFSQRLTKECSTNGNIDLTKVNTICTNFLNERKFVTLKITVPNNKTAWQIFINLNEKGQDLQISDLVKAILLTSIPETERGLYVIKWDEMKEELEGIKFDQFLHHFFVAGIENVQERDLFEYVETNYTDADQAKTLIDDIHESSKDYRKIVAPVGSGPSPDFAGDTEVIGDLKALKDLGIIHAYPVLLAGYKRFNNRLPDFKKLLDWVLKWFIRARVFCQEEPAVLESFGSTICEMIRTTYVDKITITNSGSNYTSAPTVEIKNGGGDEGTKDPTSIAEAEATISNGNITEIKVTSKGSGYTDVATSTCTVIISGDGSGATAEANLSMDSLPDIKRALIKQQNKSASKDLFIAHFKDKDKSNRKKDFYLLQKINQSPDGYNQISSDLTTLAESRKSVEHIMPQTLSGANGTLWTNDLKLDPAFANLTDEQLDEFHKANLNKWGNLTPMNKWPNSSLKNDIFYKKNNHPKGYKASNSKINNKIEYHSITDPTVAPNPWWSFKSIENRTSDLADMAEKVFKVV